MSQNKLLIRRNRNLVLRAILELQGNDTTRPITAEAIGRKLNLKPTTYASRLFTMANAGEIRNVGAGYILDAKAFEHISIKK